MNKMNEGGQWASRWKWVEKFEKWEEREKGFQSHGTPFKGIDNDGEDGEDSDDHNDDDDDYDRVFNVNDCDRD